MTGARIAGVLSIVLTILGLVLVAVVGSTDESDSSASPAPVTTTSTPTPTPTPTTAATPPEGDENGPQRRSLDRVVARGPGTCFNSDPTPGSKLSIVDCDEPHTDEYYAELAVTGTTYPGYEAVEEQADELCITAFEPYVGIPYDESALNFSYFYPSQGSWENDGDRQVLCRIIGVEEGQRITGSKRGSRE